MEHLSVYRRMLIWGLGTCMAIIAAADFGIMHAMGILDPILFIGGWAIIIVNEVVFWLRKTQLEIDRDETIKGTGEKIPPPPSILAICPQCKNRVPSESRYCLQCGTDPECQHQTNTFQKAKQKQENRFEHARLWIASASRKRCLLWPIKRLSS
jgi:hypothetical protein